ncbi:MAG TPA: hypothetical protein VIV13_03700 [Solirubrobacterales bacterium]
MGQAAFITPGKRGRWTLTVGTNSSTHQGFDQAMQAAQGLLVESGGGTIYTGAGHGLKANSFRVVCEPTSVTPALAPVSTPAPEPVSSAPAPSPPPPVTPVPPPPQTAELAAQIAALCASYEEARGEIQAFGDQAEQDIGKGTLRLEATQTLGWLRMGGEASADELGPLVDVAQELEGGKATELVIAGFDKAGEKVLKDVGKSLLGLKLVGAASFIVGLIAAFSEITINFGAALAAAVIAGTFAIGPASRMVMNAVPAGERAFFASTRWAEGLGQRTDLVLAEARQIQARLGELLGRPLPDQISLAEKARTRAELTIHLCWAAIGLGLLGVLTGFVGALG